MTYTPGKHTIYCNAEIDKSCETITLMKYYRALFLAYQDVMCKYFVND